MLYACVQYIYNLIKTDLWTGSSEISKTVGIYSIFSFFEMVICFVVVSEVEQLIFPITK